MDKKLFFGYGANRSRSKITQIIGHDPGEGVGAILEGYALHNQKLDQIPDPAKAILTKLFGHSFQAYTIRPGEGIVGGIIWSFTQEDLKKIEEWEFVGVWREIVEVIVKSEDLYTVKVLTEKVFDKFSVSNKVDGLYYDEFSFTRVAQEAAPQMNEYYTQKQIEEIRSLIAEQKENH
jgi:hypothetical protein